MVSTYKEKASGNEVQLDISEMDTGNVVFKRPGRSLERMDRKAFDDLYELQLPKVNPDTIEKVQTTPPAQPRDPNGPAVPSNVVPPADADAIVRMLRAIGAQQVSVDDRLIEIGAKVDAIYKVVAAAPAPDAPKPTT